MGCRLASTGTAACLSTQDDAKQVATNNLQDGGTPLYQAALNCHLDVVRALLESGADMADLVHTTCSAHWLDG